MKRPHDQPVGEQGRVLGTDLSGVPGNGRITWYGRQRMDLLWDRIVKLEAEFDRPISKPFRRLVRPDHTRKRELLYLLGQPPALRFLEFAQNDGTSARSIGDLQDIVRALKAKGAAL
jgi:hypothetical protein